MREMLEILRDLRKEQGLSQAKIAEKLGIWQQYYSQYESGAVELPMRHFATLVDLFDVPADYLLGRTERGHGKSYLNLYVTRDCSCETLIESVLSLHEADRRDVIEFVKYKRVQARMKEEKQ